MNGQELDELHKNPDKRYRPKNKDRVCKVNGKEKVKYLSRLNAEFAIVNLVENYPHAFGRFHVYPCPECSFFHVGRIPGE
jgi:hypothetical protein